MTDVREQGMRENEFDNFADEYAAMHRDSIRVSGEEPQYFAEYKVVDVARCVRRWNVASDRILDFGCGIGSSIPCFGKYFPDSKLTGIDVSQKSLDIARSRFPQAASYHCFDGHILPFATDSFDVIFTACVFHHIAAAAHEPLFAEIRRVLAPNGMFFIFEHNPLNPLTVRVVKDCPFDKNAVLIGAGVLSGRMARAGLRPVRPRFRVFFPHALRHLRAFERALAWCPIGAQYFLAARK